MPTKLEKNQGDISTPLFFLMLILALVAGFLILNYRNKKASRSQRTAPKAKISRQSNNLQTKASKTTQVVPTRVPNPIPHGKIPFSVSSGEKTGPQFGTGFIDPYDPKEGQMQTFSLRVKDDKGVNSVEITMSLDGGVKTTFSLRLVEGTKNAGRWEGSWQVKGSYLYMYDATVKANGGSGTSSVTITLR